MFRVAVVKSDPSVAAYMPANYVAIDASDGQTYIVGEDRAGWTLDDYVIPRLASGNHFATELRPDDAGWTPMMTALGSLDRAVLIAQAKAVDSDEQLWTDNGPGRLDGASDRELTIALDLLAGVGGGDESGGDVESTGHGVRFGRFVLLTDSNGFISTVVFRDEEQAVHALAELDGGVEDVVA